MTRAVIRPTPLVLLCGRACQAQAGILKAAVFSWCSARREESDRRRVAVREKGLIHYVMPGVFLAILPAYEAD